MDFLVTGTDNAPTTFLMAHGAGAPMDSPFMEDIARGLVEHDIRTLRFEFPYMQEARESGKRKPPNSADVLKSRWIEAIKAAGKAECLVIGGKSMGGRIASMIADQVGAQGLICLGYPFHAPGKPEKTRIEHLMQMSTPTLILQGSRDPFGSQAENDGYELSQSIRRVYLEDGDHSFKPRKKSGRTLDQNMREAIKEMSLFLRTLQ